MKNFLKNFKKSEPFLIEKQSYSVERKIQEPQKGRKRQEKQELEAEKAGKLGPEPRSK